MKTPYSMPDDGRAPATHSAVYKSILVNGDPRHLNRLTDNA